MKYYIAQDHDYYDAKTVEEFKRRCPDGYVVKKDYYDSLLNNANRGKWFFYYYCEEGISLDNALLRSFFYKLGSSIGFVSKEQKAKTGQLDSEARERNKGLYFRTDLTMLEKAKLKLIETEIRDSEGLYKHHEEILEEEYENVWDHIGGFLTVITAIDVKGAHKYVYTSFNSDDLRAALCEFFWRTKEIYKVFDSESCLFYIKYYCKVNNLVITETFMNDIKKRIEQKDEKVSYGTTAFILIEEIKKMNAAPAKSATKNVMASTQTRTLNFCPACGARIKASDSFCPTCGCKIE